MSPTLVKIRMPPQARSLRADKVIEFLLENDFTCDQLTAEIIGTLSFSVQSVIIKYHKMRLITPAFLPAALIKLD